MFSFGADDISGSTVIIHPTTTPYQPHCALPTDRIGVAKPENGDFPACN